jgi:antitoxin VapB
VIALLLHSPEAAQFAHELAAETGESIDVAVTIALRDRLRRERGMLSTPEARFRALRRISEEAATLPVFDDRTPDEILGYDDNGLPS